MKIQVLLDQGWSFWVDWSIPARSFWPSCSKWSDEKKFIWQCGDSYVDLFAFLLQIDIQVGVNPLKAGKMKCWAKPALAAFSLSSLWPEVWSIFIHWLTRDNSNLAHLSWYLLHWWFFRISDEGSNASSQAFIPWLNYYLSVVVARLLDETI